MAQFSFIPSAEVSDLAEDVREIFDELASTLKSEQRAYSGECHPALDVFETDDAVEIVMDVSGIAPEALRVVFRAGVMLIAGEKAPPVARAPQSWEPRSSAPQSLALRSPGPARPLVPRRRGRSRRRARSPPPRAATQSHSWRARRAGGSASPSAPRVRGRRRRSRSCR